MIHLRRISEEYSGMIFHALSSVLVFLIWRIAGMPSPGLLGRLIPLSWIVTAIIYGKGRIPRLSVYLLTAFTVISLFWTVNPAVVIIASACGLLGIFPGLLAVSSKKYGILLAILPLIPMILLLVPFTGDEPHYAAITENLISSGSERFSSFESQRGDPVGDFTHHQSLYPALMIPGYPLFINGLRSMNLLFALMAMLIMSQLLKITGYADRNKLAILGFLLIPGSSILGLVYPGWLALAVFLSAVYAAVKSKSELWVIAAVIVLVLIKFRFIGISAGLLTVLVIESKGRRKLMLPVVIACLGIAGLLFDILVLNGRIFWVRYGNMEFIKTILLQPLYKTPEVLIAAGASIIDIESGLLWKAPWVLAAIAGLPALKRKNGKLLLWLGLPALFYFLILIFWTAKDWSGAPTPSGRMLLPVLPVLLASLGYMLKRREVRILVWISLGISAVMFTHPAFRFNFADGTDILVSRIFGPCSSITEWVPSAVRFNMTVFAGWIAISAVIVLLLARRSRYAEYAIASVFLVLCLFGGLEKRSWEAEDIPSEYRSYCSIYPDNTDPDTRNGWLFTRQRMLRLSNCEDAIILPVPQITGDSIKMTVFYRSLQSGREPGIEISCGEWRDSIYASSEVMEAPEWTTMIRDVQIAQKPENMMELQFEFTIPMIDSGDSIRITPLGVEDGSDRYHGIYLDRILFR